MLAPALDIVRLSLHVTAATVWVGGQIAMAGLVPTLSKVADQQAVQAVARRFADLAWPAFLVLIITGIWNITAVHPSQQNRTWKAVLVIKICVVVLAGVAAYVHQRATSRTALAIWGSVSGTAAIVALVLGVALAG